MFKKIALGLILGLLFVSVSNISGVQAATTIPSLQERKANNISNAPHWLKKSINVYIPQDSRAASVRRAFLSWQNVSAGNLRFNFVNNGPADIDIVFVDSVNGADGPLGECALKIQGKTITKAEIKFATKSANINKYSNDYIYTTMVHEVGHALGLKDIPGKPTSIMHTPISATQEIKKMDVKDLFNLYGWSLLDRR